METTKQEVSGWPPRRAVVVFGIILLVLSILALCVSPFAVIASPFLFDAPGAENNSILYYFLAGLLALPVVSIVAIVASWKAARRASRAGLAVACVAAFGWIAYTATVVHELDVKCAGMFSCPSAAAVR
jgi:hypothetical protein